MEDGRWKSGEVEGMGGAERKCDGGTERWGNGEKEVLGSFSLDHKP